PAPAVLTAEDTALPIARVAVGIARGFAENRDLAAFLVPTQHAVVRNVAPDERTRVAQPYRTLGPAAAGVQALYLGEGQPVFVEGIIHHHDGGVGIALARLPVCCAHGASIPEHAAAKAKARARR